MPRCGASISATSRWRAIMSALLELEDVHTAYGLSRVLFGISIEVKEGECVCLLGRNGVGKTTTMRSVMGLTPPSCRPCPLPIARHHRPAAVPHRPRRHRLRAGGPPHLRRALGVGEPRRRPPRRRAARPLDHRGGDRPVPRARQAARPARRLSLGRRAADADHRPHPDGQSRIAAARRAVGRAWRRSWSRRCSSRSAS